MSDPVNRLSTQKGASLIPASVSEPSGHYTYCIWSSSSFLISGTIDYLYTKALLAVMYASQTLLMIGNPIILGTKKLPDIFLHGILLSLWDGGTRHLAQFLHLWAAFGWVVVSLPLHGNFRIQADENETPPSRFLNCNHKTIKSRAQKSNPYLADNLSLTCVTLLRPAIWWCFITLTFSAPRCSVSQSSILFYGVIIANLCSFVNTQFSIFGYGVKEIWNY